MIYFFDNELNMVKVATSKNVISAVHEHELNGLILGTIELDMKYAMDMPDDTPEFHYFGYYYKDNYYLHKIKRVEHEHENELVRITGRHIFFEDMLYGDYIRDVRPVNRDALYILNQTISANTRWQTIMTDTSKLHSETYYWVPPMEVLNDLTENVGIEYEPKILFDGQKINGFQLHVANRIGEDTPIRVPFGSRVLNLKYEVDYSEIVTALYGHGKGEEVGDGYGRRINFRDVDFSRNGVVSRPGSLFMENPNVTAQYGKDDGSPKFGRIIFEDIESASELANATYEAYLEQSRPKMLFEASVVDLGDVGMGDGVLIIRREYDVYFNARIHKLMVDLLDAENAEVELGDYAHFKESKVQRKTRENNNQYRRETSSRIQQLKEQFNDRFDGEVNQMREDFEQELIDAHAEIQAAEQRHNDKWEQYEAEIDGNIERIVGGSLESLDTNLLDVNSRLLSKLDESDLQPLHGRIDDAFSDISDVSGNLNTTRSELQEQLDEARAELDGLEVGGRNWFSYEVLGNRNNWNLGTYSTTKETIQLEPNAEYTFHARKIKEYLEGEWGVFVIVDGTNGTPLYGTEEYQGIKTIYNHRDATSEEVNVIEKFITPDSGRVYFSFYDHNRGDSPNGQWVTDKLVKAQIVRGDIIPDYQPAPEDTEQKITTLNQQIEFINGQLSAKLEQTDLLPINNKITEYGNSLTANAQSIESLISKTELHDGDITTWSNLTESNAEEIGRTMTRLSDIDGNIEKAELDIATNADGISGLLTRVTNTESSIADINLDVDGITADFANYKKDIDSDVGTLSAQVASYEASVDGFRAEVGTLQGDINHVDSWIAEKGSIIDGNADAISARVWMDDIEGVGANLIPQLESVWTDGRYWSGNEFNNTSQNMRLRQENSIQVSSDTDYTFSDKSSYNSAISHWLINFTDWTGTNVYGSQLTVPRGGTITYRQPAGATRVLLSAIAMEGFTINQSRIEDPGKRIYVKLEEGTQATPMLNALDRLEKRTDFVLRSDGFFLGGKYVGGDHYSTAIVGSSDGIDILADRMRVTGDLLVKGDVESYAISAIRADFQSATANYFSANLIDSNWLNVDSALANKFNANSAFINRLEVKAANIRDLDVIDIHANTFSSTVPGSNREITMQDGRARFRYGSVTIETTSGRKVIIDGYLNRSSSMVARTPSFMSDTVSVEGSWFRIDQRTYTTAHMEHYVHEARYLRANIALNRWGYTGEIADARIIAGGITSGFVSTEGKGNGTHYAWITVDLGEPLDRPIMGTAEYQFSNRHRLGAVAMHLGNRFLTDDY